MDPVTETLASMVSGLLQLVPRLIVSLVIFILALVVAGMLARLVRRSMERRGADLEITLLLARVTRWGVILFGAVVALQQVDFDLTAFLTGLGILGFTVGFAIQDVSKNLVAGILLLLQQPFDIGDAIEVAGFAGTVKTVDMRSTELLTFDGRYVLIPNADIYTSAIVNYGRSTTRRLEVKAGVAYDSDLDLASRTALEAIAAVPGVLAEPAPSVVFGNLGPSTVDLTVYYWADMGQTGFLAAQDGGVRAIKQAFEAAGIEMPFPTQTVLLRPGG